MNPAATRFSGWIAVGVLGCLALASGDALSQNREESRDDPENRVNSMYQAKGDFEGITPATLKMLQRMYAPPARLDPRAGPAAVPDIFGHGSVLTVGKINQKVTNFGFNGNPFMNTSSDPSGQWPGQSGVEYLFAQGIAVGGVNPGISPGDPVSRRRVSSGIEWRPPTLQPEDRIYPAYDGIVNGQRYGNDDDDKFLDQDGTVQSLVDEDFLDGRDNDGDGKIDEDFGALGQQMFSLVVRDDTPEAISFTQAEPHVPVGLEIRERAWAYSLTALENFNVFEYEIFNRSGHEIDSMVVGFPYDMDAGPVENSNYFTDDLDAPRFPSGMFTYVLKDGDARQQRQHDPVTGVPQGVPLCSKIDLRINGFAMVDDNGDEGKTTGVPAILLFGHTIDPLGVNGPSRVGFRAYRSYTGGTPYTQNGQPRIDQQRFEFMTSEQNIDPETGFIKVDPGDQKGDFQGWASVGPWLRVPPNASITVTIGFAVARGTLNDMIQYPTRYDQFKQDSSASPNEYLLNQDALLAQYPALKNAFDAQVAYEGIWEPARPGFPAIGDQQSQPPEPGPAHGRETAVRLARGSSPRNDIQDCRDLAADRTRQVTADKYTWFDFDCDYCSGVFNFATGKGLFHKYWNASAPPPSPILNASVSYNFTDNPSRTIAPAGDNRITLAWDNLSEITPDPGEIQGVKNVFDFRGYKIYKVSSWTRPVGSPGPSEEEWALVASFSQFNYRLPNGSPLPHNAIGKKPPPLGGDPGDTLIFPRAWIPQLRDSAEIRLFQGDLWDRQSGRILRPNRTLPCATREDGSCNRKPGCLLAFSPCREDTVTVYPVGRYSYVDSEVRNGFLYFYSVTAFDSTIDGTTEGRKAAVEAEGVVPQSGTRKGKQVWVVPNPYKGFRELQRRPSSWDLTPNATDPTGTHIDFMGLPAGRWTIRIYTVSGDLVQELHSHDAVNESVRGPVNTGTGSALPGYNRQQDTPDDGQARWNLISRNGQDVVSGIYIFTVESSEGTQRGRFVVVR